MSTENPFLLYKSLSEDNGRNKLEILPNDPMEVLKDIQVDNKTIDCLINHIGLLLIEQNNIADNPSLHISDLRNLCSSAEKINDLIRILQKMMAHIADDSHCTIQHELERTDEHQESFTVSKTS